MFGFAQWDSPLALVLEVALSLLIVVSLLFLVRRVNSRAEAERRNTIANRQQADLESRKERQDDQHPE